MSIVTPADPLPESSGRITAAITTLDGRVDALDLSVAALEARVFSFPLFAGVNGSGTLDSREDLLLSVSYLSVPFTVGGYAEARLTINLFDTSGTNPDALVKLRVATGLPGAAGDAFALGDLGADVSVIASLAAAWTCFDTGWTPIDSTLVAGDERWLTVTIIDAGGAGGQTFDVGGVVAHFR
jgi:hypothetical protein